MTAIIKKLFHNISITDNHDYSYILTTDADVKFHPEDVSALMDFMSRDPSVGAVCGRTHPMGSGPMVWYQIFDYAIGHWLLKVAEHVMGSVLCSPGCFSVYRCRAIQDILPQYASSVECALDFLTKDMGKCQGNQTFSYIILYSVFIQNTQIKLNSTINIPMLIDKNIFFSKSFLKQHFT